MIHLLIIIMFMVFGPTDFQCKTPESTELILLPADEAKQLSAQKKNNLSKPLEQPSIYLNYQDVSLGSIFVELCARKNINYIGNKELDPIKITITTHTPVTLDGAWDILTNLISINGFSLEIVDNVVRIVKKDLSKKEPLPLYVNTNLSELPQSALQIRYLYFFINIKFNQAADVLTQLLGDTATVASIPPLNAVLITGPAININYAMQVVEELDQSGLREDLRVIELIYANAIDAEKLLKELSDIKDEDRAMRFLTRPPQEVAFFSKETKIIANPTNNTLILLGTRENLRKLEAFIKSRVDIEQAAPDSRLHIKELKYTDSEKIAKLVFDMIKQTGDNKGGNLFDDTIIVAEPSQIEAQDEVSMGGGAGNRIIIACNNEAWKRIESFIDKLDKPSATVAIEVLFIEASYTDDKELTAQIRDKKPGQIGRGIDAQSQQMAPYPVTVTPAGVIPTNFTTTLRTDMINAVFESARGLNPSSYFTIGCVDNIWGAVQLVMNGASFNTVGQPFLVTNHNQEATLTLEQQLIVAGSLDANSVTPVQQQVPLKASFKLQLTPRVNINNEIGLKLNFELSTFKTVVTNGVPDIQKRTVATRNAMHNGEVLVIGGLLRRDNTETINKTPLLGDIPIFGNLFKGRSLTTIITDLYVFIRPTIIKPRFEGRPEDYTQLKLDYARRNLYEDIQARQSNDPIQRWFFSNKFPEAGNEIDQLDNFVSSKLMPKSINMAQDAYYRKPTAPTMQVYEQSSLARKEASAKKMSPEKRKKVMPKTSTP